MKEMSKRLLCFIVAITMLVTIPAIPTHAQPPGPPTDPWSRDASEATIRLYGNDSEGPDFPYDSYLDAFNPLVIPKDSITFNPAIIEWNESWWAMYAGSYNIHVKKYLRMWYEPDSHVWHKRTEFNYPIPTIFLESTYMLIERQDYLPISGPAGGTRFAFPIAEKDGQYGLGSFDGDGDGAPDLVDLIYVDNGVIDIVHTFNMQQGDTVQFLDHKIKLIGVDIDGTLTDGKLYYIEGMNEPLKTFNVKDGMAVYLAKKAGIKIAIISGLNSRASEKRARKLGIEDAFFGVMEKAPIMRKIMEKYGLKKGEAIFLGDDIQDIPAMDEAGLGAAVSDAVEEVKKRAEIILGSKGGEGALRELVELILRNRK